jgi:hypothetical protein
MCNRTGSPLNKRFVHVKGGWQMTIFLLFVCSGVFSQNYHSPYEDEYLGWIKVYNFKGVSKPLKVDEKNYTTAQLSIIDSFANWMQASYTPKGGLGDIKKYVTPQKNVYNDRYNEAVPPSYGASAVTYKFLKKVNGKWTPENNLGHYWTIAANEIPMDNRLTTINTNKVCLFTIPEYDKVLLKEQPNDFYSIEKRMYDLSGYPTVSKYLYYTRPTANNQEQVRSVVILSKDNRFPFVQVTVGEMLKYMEDAFPVKYAEEKKTAYEQNSYDANHLANAMKSLDTKYDKAKAMLNRLKEKYKNRLTEFAYGSDYSVISLANGADIFTNGRDTDKFDKSKPVYRVDPAMEAYCKTDKPQWITIKWFGGELEDPYFKHMFESVVNNFDFDYVYNFFFDPVKVKGKAYRPRRSPVFEPEVKLAEKSADALKKARDPGVFYFEDFSTTMAGQKANGWKSEMNAEAKTAKVVDVENRKEKWLEIKGQYFVFPQNITKPLPADFELSFDLAVPKDIPWGAKALEFYLGTKNNYDENAPSFLMRIRAGFSGRPGEGSITGKFGNGYFNEYKSFEATGFSNDKDFNTVKVTFRKRGESLVFLLDKNTIVDLPKAFTANSVFNWFQFKHLNSSGDNQKYFITNVKIVKL